MVLVEPVGPGALVAGRFRLEDLLEDHSGARSWRATDLTLARHVAVHVIPTHDPRAAAALTAARTSATVSDGRILRVLDALEEGDHVSVVHEWGSGMSLDQLVADGPLPPRRAAWLVREVAEAVTVAHRHGIAHGRLLPENVMVNDAGSVKLIGFVVDAVLLGRAEDQAFSEHESDVRNLAALLYAALTARWPGAPASVLPSAPTERGQVCRPRQVRSGVPRALDALCDEVLNGDNAGTTGATTGAATTTTTGASTTTTNGAARSGAETAAEVASALTAFLGERPTDALFGQGLDEQHDLAAPETDRDPERTQAWRPEGLGGATDAGVLATPPRYTGSSAAAPPPVTAPALPHWGPDRSDDPPPPTGPPHRGVPWLRLAAALAAVAALVLGAVVALNLVSGSAPPGETDRAGSSQKSPKGTPSRVLGSVVLSDFDPDSTDTTPAEHPELLPLATDGKRATAWRTETYFGGPQLAPFKRGVGLLLDLGRETRLAEVDLSLLSGPYDLTLFAAPPEAAAPTDVAGLDRVARETGVSGRVRLAPDRDITTRYLVTWLTALPRTASGYQGQIAEVVVRS